MRKASICAFLAVLLMASALTGAAWPDEENVAAFSVGKAAVWAIGDSIYDWELAENFPAVDPRVIAEYAPSGMAPSAAMVFLVKFGDEVILIDSGWGSTSSRLGEGLQKVGVAPEDITLVLITHMHPDHIGGLIRDNGKAFPSARVLSSRMERDFWLDEKSPPLFPQPWNDFELARKVMGLYGSATGTFEFDAEVIPGIRALDASGHTPGHTAFLLESEGEKILFWGDIMHSAALQFPRPDINPQYDMTQEKAVATRVRFMEKAAEEKLLIAGAHPPFPGVGAVEKNTKGGFTYISR